MLHERLIAVPAMDKGVFKLRIRVLDVMVAEKYTSHSTAGDHSQLNRKNSIDAYFDGGSLFYIVILHVILLSYMV